MFKFNPDFSSLQNATKNFKGVIYFGIPRSNSRKVIQRGKKKVPPRDEFTNADILWIMEHGSPAKNIVPRPLLRQVLTLHRKELEDKLYWAIPLVLEGNQSKIDTYFETLALDIQRWAQMYFIRDGQLAWEPSQRVLRAEKRGEKANTLIDTGSLRQSIIAYYSKDGKTL